ncbi:histidine kinase [Solwaraspora sp. WMMD1047]|uniref:sensor histidine kinase n=1 Tax=Solwaraspora sp. WMMD1047 TaxID=3016102 RepID=UPI002416A360|nr:histidine kinase [Solwaraspora sp. WMMD1047]MDG4829032.1 histidine kinase [Solwaraspora sp. WMMD1047]
MGVRRSARDWGVDAALVAGAAVLGGLFLLSTVTAEPLPPTLPPLGLDIGIGVAACVAVLLFRRRWPVALALACIPVALISSAAMGPTALAVFTVAAYRSWRVTAAVAGAHLLMNVLVLEFAPITQRQYVETVVTMLLLDTALVATGMLVRSQRMLVRSLQDRARQAEEGQRLRVEEARHLERERLAREMHDVLAHRISLLAVHAGALEFRRTATAEEARAAGVIRQSAYDALEDLREVLGMLRGTPGGADPERPQPTLADLPALVEESRRAGMRVVLDDRLGKPDPVPAGIGRHVYRIVQEGLTNARKHAPGAEVRVTLTAPDQATEADPAAADQLAIEVVNPMPLGIATAEIPGAGAGLIGLRERLDLIGGRLEHERTPGGDFRLRAWIPWRA